MGIFQELIEAAEHGRKFSVNIQDKRVTIGRKTYNLTEASNSDIYGLERVDTIKCMSIIENLFKAYYSSYPTESSQRRRRCFQALNFDELDDIDLVKGESRDVAQAKLEGYVLFSILNGSLQFDEPWFWQSKQYPKLIIFKDWLKR